MGGGGLEKVIEKRLREMREALVKAERFARCAAERLAPAAAILYGSFSRGDFNEWSDLDVLIVTGKRLPPNPLRRLDAIEDCLRATPEAEPLILTLDELEKSIERCNPAATEALTQGTLLADTGVSQTRLEKAKRLAERCKQYNRRA